MVRTQIGFGGSRVREFVAIGLIAVAALTVSSARADVEPLAEPVEPQVLHGFTREGHMKVGPTDRESGVFPQEVKAYPLAPSYVYQLDAAIAARIVEDSQTDPPAAAGGSKALAFRANAALFPPAGDGLSGLPGFTRDGLMKVGDTDRESGVFPPGVEAYELSPSRSYVLDPAIALKISEDPARDLD